MTLRAAFILTLTASVILIPAPVRGQSESKKGGQAAAAPVEPDKASAYYQYSLGHMYAELAATYNNRSDYFTKAIEAYRAAMKADPSAGFVSEELSDLYVQSGRLREAVTDAEEALKQNPSDMNARRLLARIYSRLIGENQGNRPDETYVRKALEQYQKLAEQNPKDIDAWVMTGRLNKLLHNSPEAEKAYKKALEIDSSNEDAMSGLAMVYVDLGDMKSASDVLKRLADKNPNGRSLAALAQTYESMREYALAAETLKRAIELNQGSADMRRALAQNLMLSDQLDDALKVYADLLAEDPKDVMSELRVSQIYRQRGDFAKAHAAADKAKEIDPANFDVRFNEVKLLESEGKTPDALAAMRDLVKSTVKRTYNPQEKAARVLMLEQLGIMYRTAEQYGPAVESFQQIADLDADLAGRAAVQVVETYRQAKDFKKAETTAENALVKSPSDRMLRNVYASILADEGKAEAAITEMKKLVAEKKDRETYISLAQVYEKTKRYTEMAQAIDEAEKLSEGKDEKETIFFMRGAMYEKMKKFDSAEAEFRKVIGLNPENSSALNYLGYMFADRNQHLQEALQMVSKALVREPGNPAYLDSLGWVYYKLGQFPEAESNLKASLEKMGKDPTVHDHLGDVYFKQGKLKEAIQQWERSLIEWDATSPAEQEQAEIAKVQKKLEGAKVRQAKEGK